jgi:H+/Cl- antiporter ClcA
MGAILGGTMRSPFTGVIFALELTHDVNRVHHDLNHWRP